MSGEVELTVPADPPPVTEPATATAPKSRVSAKLVAIGLVGLVAVAALVVGIVALSRDENSPSPSPPTPTSSSSPPPPSPSPPSPPPPAPPSPSPPQPSLPPPSPPPTGMRFSVGAATAEQQARINEAELKMKTTPSPWASGVDTRTGRSVPRRWHNLTWWDTLVTIHSTQHMGGNPFAHFGPAFPMWHRLFLDVLEQGLNDVMPGGEQITQFYWDWTSPVQTTRLWQNETIGGDGFGECVQDGPFAHAAGGWNITVAENLVLPFGTPGVQSPSCLVRQFSLVGTLGGKNPTLPSSNNVAQALQIAAYDSWPYDKNAFGSISFRNVLEGWGGPYNEGPNHGVKNPPSRMHNQGHIWTGGTMLSMAAPNDPAFFYHHANVDRLYQSWLENSGQLYAGKEPSAADYPAQLTPLTNAACKQKYPDFRIFLVNVQGVMTLEVSPSGTSVECGSACLQSITGEADWGNDALTAAREILVYCMQEGAWDGVSKEAATRLFSQSAQTLRIALAWPENDANAATIPPVDEQFLDPQVFKAELPLASNPSVQNTHTYESFTLAGAYAPGGGSSSSVFLVEPTMVDRATLISLAQPVWLNRLNVNQPAVLDELRMVAIAVDNAGFKLNLKGWTPTHYWGPGVADQLIVDASPAADQRRVVVSFAGDVSNPAIRCVDFNASDPDGSGLSKCETLNGPVGLTGKNAKGGTPWEQLIDQQQLKTNALTRWEEVNCMNTSELRAQGFVNTNTGAETPEQLMPVEADFCLITFTLLPSPFLNATSLALRNAASWPSTATTFVAPRLARSNSWYQGIGSAALEVTDNIYIGARPGHNQQDNMVPFDQLGFEYSPAHFFDASTASYAPSNV